ncbi:MAG: D-aminoacyl-tRNA deacylase, partial [Steroidobacteraceae bacterium]
MQRVSQAEVRIDDKRVSAIGVGLLVLVGIVP